MVDSERTSGSSQSGTGLFNPTRRADFFKDGERTLHQRSTFPGVRLELKASIASHCRRQIALHQRPAQRWLSLDDVGTLSEALERCLAA